MRYSRQLPLLKDNSVEMLKHSTIAVIGVGGVGNAVLPLLVGAGVGKIKIVDGDCVSLSNLHRQTIFNEDDISKNKAIIAKEKLSKLNSQVEIVYRSTHLENQKDAQEFISGADLCIDTTDSFLSRTFISEACAKENVLEIACTAGEWVAQLYFFDKSFKFADIAPNAQEKAQYLPIFPPAAHLSGVWGASEAIKIITKQREFQAGYFQSFDFQNNKFIKANLI